MALKIVARLSSIDHSRENSFYAGTIVVEAAKLRLQKEYGFVVDGSKENPAFTISDENGVYAAQVTQKIVTNAVKGDISPQMFITLACMTVIIDYHQGGEGTALYEVPKKKRKGMTEKIHQALQ